MISTSILDQLTTRQQTTRLNIRREYVQHLFLSHFYRQTSTDGFLFKGGTALKIAFGSPRFSEDLDFSSPRSKTKTIEGVILDTLKDVGREGVQADIIEAKETSGGYLSELLFTVGKERVTILLQLSRRTPHDTHEVVTIVSDVLPAYTVVLLDRKQLVAEKIHAALTRAKPRDFYDVYFLARSGLLPKEEKARLMNVKRKLETTSINFERELKPFLPKSHWPVLRDFKFALERELDRFRAST
jgi:predicted nucleotidyltransferase component of viral defense system